MNDHISNLAQQRIDELGPYFTRLAAAVVHQRSVKEGLGDDLDLRHVEIEEFRSAEAIQDAADANADSRLRICATRFEYGCYDLLKQASTDIIRVRQQLNKDNKSINTRTLLNGITDETKSNLRAYMTLRTLSKAMRHAQNEVRNKGMNCAAEYFARIVTHGVVPPNKVEPNRYILNDYSMQDAYNEALDDLKLALGKSIQTNVIAKDHNRLIGLFIGSIIGAGVGYDAGHDHVGTGVFGFLVSGAMGWGLAEMISSYCDKNRVALMMQRAGSGVEANSPEDRRLAAFADQAITPEQAAQMFETAIVNCSRSGGMSAG